MKIDIQNKVNIYSQKGWKYKNIKTFDFLGGTDKMKYCIVMGVLSDDFDKPGFAEHVKAVEAYNSGDDLRLSDDIRLRYDDCEYVSKPLRGSELSFGIITKATNRFIGLINHLTVNGAVVIAKVYRLNRDSRTPVVTVDTLFDPCYWCGVVDTVLSEGDLTGNSVAGVVSVSATDFGALKRKRLAPQGLRTLYSMLVSAGQTSLFGHVNNHSSYLNVKLVGAMLSWLDEDASMYDMLEGVLRSCGLSMVQVPTFGMCLTDANAGRMLFSTGEQNEEEETTYTPKENEDIFSGFEPRHFKSEAQRCMLSYTIEKASTLIVKFKAHIYIHSGDNGLAVFIKDKNEDVVGSVIAKEVANGEYICELPVNSGFPISDIYLSPDATTRNTGSKAKVAFERAEIYIKSKGGTKPIGSPAFTAAYGDFIDVIRGQFSIVAPLEAVAVSFSRATPSTRGISIHGGYRIPYSTHEESRRIFDKAKSGTDVSAEIETIRRNNHNKSVDTLRKEGRIVSDMAWGHTIIGGAIRSVGSGVVVHGGDTIGFYGEQGTYMDLRLNNLVSREPYKVSVKVGRKTVTSSSARVVGGYYDRKDNGGTYYAPVFVICRIHKRDSEGRIKVYDFRNAGFVHASTEDDKTPEYNEVCCAIVGMNNGREVSTDIDFAFVNDDTDGEEVIVRLYTISKYNTLQSNTENTFKHIKEKMGRFLSSERNWADIDRLVRSQLFGELVYTLPTISDMRVSVITSGEEASSAMRSNIDWGLTLRDEDRTKVSEYKRVALSDVRADIPNIKDVSLSVIDQSKIRSRGQALSYTGRYASVEGSIVKDAEDIIFTEHMRWNRGGMEVTGDVLGLDFYPSVKYKHSVENIGSSFIVAAYELQMISGIASIRIKAPNKYINKYTVVTGAEFDYIVSVAKSDAVIDEYTSGNELSIIRGDINSYDRNKVLIHKSVLAEEVDATVITDRGAWETSVKYSGTKNAVDRVVYGGKVWLAKGDVPVGEKPRTGSQYWSYVEDVTGMNLDAVVKAEGSTTHDKGTDPWSVRLTLNVYYGGVDISGQLDLSRATWTLKERKKALGTGQSIVVSELPTEEGAYTVECHDERNDIIASTTLTRVHIAPDLTAEALESLKKLSKELSDKIALLESTRATEAQLNELLTSVNAKLSEQQKQIDGEVSNWFGPGAPNASKAPESEWTTNLLKARHINDTYTSTDKEGQYAGLSWRYTTKFTWEQIADTQIVQALKLAGDAKATADGKSTTYYQQPDGYHVGDSWLLQTDTAINGKTYKAGTIVYAHADRVTGFVQADWKPNAYITQAEIDNIKVGTRNLIRGGKKLTVRGGVTIIPAEDAVAGDEYVLSVGRAVNVQSGRYDSTRFLIYDEQYKVNKRVSISNTRQSVKFTVGVTGLRIALCATISWEGVTEFYDIILTKGNQIVDFVEAPEDIEERYQKLISAVDVEFALGNSMTVAPSSGWQTTAPAPQTGKYLWQRTKTTLKDGNVTYKGVTCIQGKHGTDGAKGKGVKSVTEQYYHSTSMTALTGGSWGSVAPTPAPGKWIWTRSVIAYDDNTSTTTSPICVTGDKGDKGAPGKDGDPGKDGAPGKDGKDAINYSAGLLLYGDPTFTEGVNWTHKYNNAGGNTTVWERIAKPADCPSSSTHAMSYKYLGGGSTQPGLGGFAYHTTSRANAVFVYRIIAKIPMGYKISYATNPYGDGGTQQWLTEQLGTGKYEEYVILIKCGSTGSFSSIGYFYFDKSSVNTPNAPFEVIVSYATAFDMTSAPNYYQQLGKEQRARVEAEQKLRQDLGNANKIISTLQKLTEEIQSGKLDASRFADIQYLLDALQKNSAVQTGILLSNDIILSRATDGQVTAYLSGEQGEGRAMLRCGVKDAFTPNETARVTIWSNGTVEIGNMRHVVTDNGGDYIEFEDKAANHTYMQIGGNATSESDMILGSTKHTVYQLGTILTISKDHEIDRFVNSEGRRWLNYTLDVGIIRSERSAIGRPMTLNKTTVDIKLQVAIAGSNGAHKQTLNSEIKRQVVELLATTKTEYMFGKISFNVPESAIAKGDAIMASVILRTSDDSRYDEGGWGLYVKDATVTIPKDTLKSLVTITKDKVAFFFGRQKYLLFNYFNDWLLKIVGNVLVQGTLQAEYIETSGAVLAGGQVDANGGVSSAFGRYHKHPSRGVDYVEKLGSGKSCYLRVHHSIGSTRYVPFVTPANTPYSDQPSIVDKQANYFDVRFYNTSGQSYHYPFNYICHRADE